MSIGNVYKVDASGLGEASVVDRITRLPVKLDKRVASMKSHLDTLHLKNKIRYGLPEIFVIKSRAKFANKIIQVVAGTVTNVRVRVTRHNFVTRKWETTVADVIRGRRQSRDGFRPTASNNIKKRFTSCHSYKY